MPTVINLTNNQDIDGILWGWRWDTNNLTFSFPTAQAEYSAYAQIDNFSAFSAAQITAARRIIDNVESFCNLNITETTNAGATLRFAEATAINFTNDNTVGTFTGLHTVGQSGTAEAAPPEAGFGGAAPATPLFAQGDSWYTPGGYDAPNLGSFQYAAGLMHETGHNLGLKHGHATQAGHGQTFPVLPADHDSYEYSVMTYREFPGANFSSDNSPNHPTTFMQNDIQALQLMYGANYNYNATDTVYSWSTATGEFFINGAGQGLPFDNAGAQSNTVFMTIWDGNGNDTYDFSNYGTNITADLRPGQWVNLGMQLANLGNDNVAGQANYIARGNIASALPDINLPTDVRSRIENVNGGTGNDTLIGNEVANRLSGGNGTDTLYGQGSSDTLYGGNDGDTLFGEAGFDRLVGGAGADYLDGGFDRDTASYEGSSSWVYVDLSFTNGKCLYGDAQGDTLVSIESIAGSSFDDDLRGNADFNVISGSFGNDEIIGNGGRDELRGDGGNDVITGVSGDYIYGGTENDTVIFAATSDTYVTFDRVTGSTGGAALGVSNIFEVENFLGKSGNDIMYGDSSAETFWGYGGTDELRAREGNDTLVGGASADIIDGGIGSDTASYAGSASFVAVDLSFTNGKCLYGDAQGDTLFSIENLTGSAFDDDLRGDAGANILRGMEGNDDLYTMGGADLMEGGTGNDTYLVDSDFAMVREAVGAGYDRVIASATYRLHQLLAEVELLTTNDGNATTAIDLFGSNHSNTIVGNAGVNSLNGRLGNDFIYTGAGADIMDGGGDFDTFVFHKAMVADWQSGVLDADIASDSWSNWDAIQGSSGADRIRTNSWGFAVELRGGAGADVLATGVTGIVADTLRGEAGNDDLNGGAGDDKLYGGADSDTMFGDVGDDTFYMDTDGVADTASGGAGVADVLDFFAATAAIAVTFGATAFAGTASGGGLGTDSFTGIERVLASIFADTVTGGAGGEYISARAGADWVSVGDGADTVNGDTGADRIYGGAGNDTVYGGADGDTWLGGDAGLDYVSGGDGADRVDGGADSDSWLGGDAGADYITGGDGDDRIDGGADGDSWLGGGAGADYITGGDGNDRVDGGSGNNTWLGGGAGGDYITGGDGDDRADGGTEGDTINGGAGRDYITGGGGNDTITGGSETGLGDVWLGGDAGVDYVSGGFGDDRLDGGADGDSLYGNDGLDTLTGGLGVDWIDGGAGADYFEGGDGNDRLTGGAGADTFNFNVGTDYDSVTDFTNDVDTLRIDPGFGFANVAAVLARTIQSGNHARVLLNAAGTDSVYLLNYLTPGNGNTIANLGDDIVIG